MKVVMLALLLGGGDGGWLELSVSTANRLNGPTSITLYDGQYVEPEGGWRITCYGGSAPFVRQANGVVFLSCKRQP